MEVWISRDSEKFGGNVLAWANDPEWNGVLWYREMDRFAFSVHMWTWKPHEFENAFGFLPDCGTCHRMLMQIKPIEDQPNG